MSAQPVQVSPPKVRRAPSVSKLIAVVCSNKACKKPYVRRALSKADLQRKRHCCSHACTMAVAREVLAKARASGKVVPRKIVQTSCAHCGAPVTRRVSASNVNKNYFCSRDCSCAHMLKARGLASSRPPVSGVKPIPVPEGSARFTCCGCGQSFVRSNEKTSKAQRTGTKPIYCTKACAGRTTFKKHNERLKEIRASKTDVLATRKKAPKPIKPTMPRTAAIPQQAALPLQPPPPPFKVELASEPAPSFIGAVKDLVKGIFGFRV